MADHSGILQRALRMCPFWGLAGALYVISAERNLIAQHRMLKRISPEEASQWLAECDEAERQVREKAAAMERHGAVTGSPSFSPARPRLPRATVRKRERGGQRSRRIRNPSISGTLIRNPRLTPALAVWEFVHALRENAPFRMHFNWLVVQLFWRGYRTERDWNAAMVQELPLWSTLPPPVHALAFELARQAFTVDQKRACVRHLLELFEPDFDLGHRRNQAFLLAVAARLPVERRGDLVQHDGRPASGSSYRVRNVVLPWVYGEIPEVADILQVDNLARALLLAAPAAFTMRDGIASGWLHPLDLVPDLIAAASRLAVLRQRQDAPVKEYYLSLHAVFADESLTPFQEQLLLDLDRLEPRPAAVARVIVEYVVALERLGDPRSGDLFSGELALPTIPELWNLALQRAEAALSVEVSEA